MRTILRTIRKFLGQRKKQLDQKKKMQNLNITFNNTSSIGKNVFNYGCNIKIGNNVWIGDNCSFHGGGDVIIGNNTHIGPNSVVTSSKDGGGCLWR